MLSKQRLQYFSGGGNRGQRERVSKGAQQRLEDQRGQQRIYQKVFKNQSKCIILGKIFRYILIKFLQYLKIYQNLKNKKCSPKLATFSKIYTKTQWISAFFIKVSEIMPNILMGKANLNKDMGKFHGLMKSLKPHG